METLYVSCPYCGKLSEHVGDEEIYNGRSFGNTVYLCRPCWAYVGCHKGTDNPKGTLANDEVRKLRMEAHALFDPLWMKTTGSAKRIRRMDFYHTLSTMMGIKFAHCHFGMFQKEELLRAIECIKTIKETMK